MNAELLDHLTFLYGAEMAAHILPRLTERIEYFEARFSNKAAPKTYFDEKDAILITYGDMVQAEEERPLATLASFLYQQLRGIVNTVHLLPFYPYSSDDGFSVIDYWAVDDALGSWDDVAEISRDFQLMFDAVVNHISAQSDWFQGFLRGESPFTDYFITVDPSEDLTDVFRPRALPLLTEQQTSNGARYVWTTFSPDQIDLNFSNPDLLLKITELLLFYVSKGARFIRLDAIGFMWKEIGTNCLHLPQTHRIIQLWRTILDRVAPHVVLITETNVPHQENISYFGNGRNEAQMVYNFSLPPLLLHTFHCGNARQLSEWATTLELPSDRVTFFNFCASHDGIGLTPARGILSTAEIEAIATRVQALGGFVSYKANGDGSQSAYELNISYLNALGVPHVAESRSWIARRFLASQAIMLALRGVPGIYFHSLFGSQNWLEGMRQTGRNRTINRQKLQYKQLEAELSQGLRQMILTGYTNLLRHRTAEKAFHPTGQQEILNLHPAVFAISRTHAQESILCLHNVSSESVAVTLPDAGTDLLTETAVSHQLTLAPYQVAWIKIR